MAAPKGNQFWKQRTKHGRDKIFASAELLWEACEEYFEWVQGNPLYEDSLVTFQGVATHEPIAKMHAMTIQGLCLFIDIHYSTWVDWRNQKNDFSEVCTRAEAVIYTQKFTGASAGLLNPSIIARDLGLVDKKDLSSSDGTMSPNQLTEEQIDQRIKDIVAKKKA